MRVDWRDLAIKDLDEIHIQIGLRKGVKFANRLIDRIFDKSALLESFPKMGAIQQSLEDLEIRYLIEGDYKILYRINLIVGIIEILSVFDTRQDPSKMLSKED